MTHTPTPWIVGKTNIRGHNNAIFQAQQSGSYRALAIMDIADDHTDEANAALIVKAVNLHTELVECLDVARNGLQWFIDDNGGADEADYETLRRIEAALDKAKAP